MNNRKAAAAAAVLLLAVFVSARGLAQESKSRKYIFQVPMVKGLSMGSMSQSFNSYMNAMSNLLGIKVEYQEYQFQKGTHPADDILKMVKAGKVDFTYLYASEYVMIKDEVDKVMTPFLTITMLKKRQTGVCAYVKKDAPYEKLSDLKGKKWGGTETMRTRFLLHREGIDEPLAKFFGSMTYIDDGDIRKPLDEVIDGKIDVYTAYELLASMLKSNNRKYVDELKQVGCGDFEHNWIFFYKNDVPKDIVGMVGRSMLQAHKDKELVHFKLLLTAIKGNFEKYDPKDLAATVKTVELMKKFKWMDEEQSFLKPHLK